MKEFDSKEPTPIVAKADALLDVQKAQQEAALKNAAKRQQERQEKQEAWSDPDAITYRMILHQKKSFESLQSMKAAGQCVIQVPLPPESEWPKEWRGQQPSTIRAMMGQDSKYRASFREYAEKTQAKDERRNHLREKYPEMFGIDDEQARKRWKPDPEAKDQTKGGFTVKEGAGSTAQLAQKPEPGFVAKMFAGIFGKTK